MQITNNHFFTQINKSLWFALRIYPLQIVIHYVERLMEKEAKPVGTPGFHDQTINTYAKQRPGVLCSFTICEKYLYYVQTPLSSPIQLLLLVKTTN